MISRIKNKIIKLVGYYKKGGLIKLCKYVFPNLVVFNKFAVFEFDVTSFTGKETPRIPVDIRLLTNSEADINKITEFWPAAYTHPYHSPQDTRNKIIRYLSDGDDCMIVEYRGNIIHMTWIGYPETYKFNDFEMKRGLAADEVLSHQAYCTSEYRGNNLMAAVQGEIIHLAKRKGYKKVIGYVPADNIASRKMNQKLGGPPAQMVYGLAILGYGVYFVTKRRDRC